MAVEIQNRDYESQLVEARQRQTILATQLAEQKRLAAESRYLKMMKIGGQATGQEIAEQAKIAAIKHFRKVVWRWIWGVLAAIFGNPITWVVLGALVVVIIGAWCFDNKTECVATAGLGFWEIVKFWFS